MGSNLRDVSASSTDTRNENGKTAATTQDAHRESMALRFWARSYEIRPTKILFWEELWNIAYEQTIMVWIDIRSSIHAHSQGPSGGNILNSWMQWQSNQRSLHFWSLLLPVLFCGFKGRNRDWLNPAAVPNANYSTFLKIWALDTKLLNKN